MLPSNLEYPWVDLPHQVSTRDTWQTLSEQVQQGPWREPGIPLEGQVPTRDNQGTPVKTW
jgi:hypothetical protein